MKDKITIDTGGLVWCHDGLLEAIWRHLRDITRPPVVEIDGKKYKWLPDHDWKEIS